MNKMYLNNCRYITLFILLTTFIFSQDVQSTETDLPKNTESTAMGAAFLAGKSLKVDGTNVVRVPFGVRQARKQRPQRPQRWATLVLPLQPVDSPNPPPQAA